MEREKAEFLFQLEEQRLDDEAREADIAGWSRKLRGDHAVSIPASLEQRHQLIFVMLLGYYRTYERTQEEACYARR